MNDEHGHDLADVEGYEGISACGRCGGAEASLPFHCPGVKMSAEQQDEVQDGKLEFLYRRWWVPKA